MFQKLRQVLKLSFKPPDGIIFVLRCSENLPVIMESYIGAEGGGRIAWTPRLPNLISLDFFMWGYVKDEVTVPFLPASLEELLSQVTEAVATIQVDMTHRTSK